MKYTVTILKLAEKFIVKLPKPEKERVLKAIYQLPEGNDIKELRGKKNKGLYELRIKFSSNIARIFYFTYYNNKFVLLHGFIKKTMKIPESEIKKARKYMEDYRRRAGL